ncbi:MAG: DoxX family protein [Bacteroidetes bacterium]|nr:DoxX family protein [Bacteroidota bacterium]MBS1975914.1 DoxX family protein [Bacteroidota bacterium]
MDVQNLYKSVRKRRWLSFAVIWSRYLIGFAFIPSGMTKLLGNRFTSLPVSDPVGYFFEAMYRTGWYWNFLGGAQLTAALLLMTQRFASAGNLIFFPLSLNIFLITWSVGFKGTVYITGLMLMASLGLLLWDYPKWRSMLATDNSISTWDMENWPTYNRHWIITGMILFVEGVGMALTGHYAPGRIVSLLFLALMALTFLVSVILFRFRKA